jgi:hypothetical protein
MYVYMGVAGRVLPMFHILYPERRVVTSERILTWYTDAVANEQIVDIGAISAHRAACRLHQAGLITLCHSLPRWA